ncbi:MAG TPA: MGMT family protein [Bacteroidota bacterium]|nr:MGMT family protein [Bacteroidota bacterium]
MWETVKQIPEGKVASYSDVAELSGLARQQRLVGYALHNLPPHSGVPWQRVVNSKGQISFPRGTRNYFRQKKLLEKEGIEFDNGVIDFEKFGVVQSLTRKFLNTRPSERIHEKRRPRRSDTSASSSHR